ncbi:MAG: glycosyl hydrolase family 28-related protein [Kiritimatiellae bacterium]|jgi:hypothetical protein|nr:glycosyl hydrolase family 28-related protein [Kiritimatiellia bacterium]
MTETNPQTRSRLFNVLDYGAVGDGETDNTKAFSACLESIIKVGGGQMHLPSGVYKGRILIPSQVSSWLVIEITGEGQPVPAFGTIGSLSLTDNGTIIQSLETSGPAVISAIPDQDSPYGIFSMLCVVIRNMEVRTYDNPAIDGIDLQHVVQCRIENVVVNTVYCIQTSKPTHGTSGILTPACNNAALTILRNVVVTGYHNGIVVNEHTDGDNINLACNFNGLLFSFAHHASRFGRVCTQRCTNNITVTGKHGFCIQQLDIEIAGEHQKDNNNAWQATEFNINDPDNLGTADINYWVVEGDVGAVETFTRNGADSICARRIGSASIPEKPAENTINPAEATKIIKKTTQTAGTTTTPVKHSPEKTAETNTNPTKLPPAEKALNTSLKLKETNRRAEHRVRLDIKARIGLETDFPDVKISMKDDIIPCVISDLSIGGLKIIIYNYKVIPVNVRVRVYIQINKFKEITLLGVVRWRKMPPGTPAQLLGVEFLVPKKTILDQWIEYANSIIDNASPNDLVGETDDDPWTGIRG